MSRGLIRWFAPLLAIAMIYTANSFGLWYVTFIVGLCLTGLPVRRGNAVGVSALVSGLGWFIPLLWAGFFDNFRSAASVITAVMGFGSTYWWIADFFTIVTGVLLGVAGTWLGTAIWNLFRPAPSTRITSPSLDAHHHPTAQL